MSSEADDPSCDQQFGNYSYSKEFVYTLHENLFDFPQI